ncbi:hypothetical protein PGIGA_G00060300 [Pangasianodon gigas]|uniref:Uncharacterized protein n=1 Tax=Pangasianodon gigas TaxID=30993 RepID=A0ACC5X549_PANGG|nr:hypothetical protein [Pangasianodon gigas]
MAFEKQILSIFGATDTLPIQCRWRSSGDNRIVSVCTVDSLAIISVNAKSALIDEIQWKDKDLQALES